MRPKVLGAAFAALAAALFFGSGPRTVKEDDTSIQDCWFNPKTRRMEPPAPWDPAFKAAKRAGETRTAKRSELSP